MRSDMMSAASSFARYNRLLFSVCGFAGLMYGIDIGLIASALPYIKATDSAGRDP